MSERSKLAYEQWKAADQAARLKEEELKRVWNLYFKEKKVPPSDALIREVSALRAKASELLREVIRLTGSAGSGQLRS